MTPLLGDDPLADTKIGNALTRAIVDTIHEPFLVLDVNLRIIVASRSFYEKFQVVQGDTQGKYLYDIGNGQWDIPILRDLLSHIISGHKVMEEYKITHNFQLLGQRTMLLSAREVFYEDSSKQYVLLTIVDDTDRELLNTERERSMQQKDLLMQEMKHRMANSLQLIASILILKAEKVDSIEVRKHLQDAHERIVSIATIEKYLDTTSLEEEVEVGPYLNGLCKSLAKSMVGSTRPITLVVTASAGATTSANGISLGLITAELVINALKHAFPKEVAGNIAVDYQQQGVVWQLKVSDNGRGYSSDTAHPRKEGLGTSIVQSLARQLGAHVTLQTSEHGTAVTITTLPAQTA